MWRERMPAGSAPFPYGGSSEKSVRTIVPAAARVRPPRPATAAIPMSVRRESGVRILPS